MNIVILWLSEKLGMSILTRLITNLTRSLLGIMTYWQMRSLTQKSSLLFKIPSNLEESVHKITIDKPARILALLYQTGRRSHRRKKAVSLLIKQPLARKFLSQSNRSFTQKMTHKRQLKYPTKSSNLWRIIQKSQQLNNSEIFQQ